MKNLKLLLILFLSIFSVTSFSQKTSYFPETENWTKTNNPRVYHPENLWDYINGAADSYLAYNFEELTVIEYKKGDDEIVAQLYQHENPNHAFGIYSTERPADANFIDIGIQGYQEGSILNFLDDKYYIKIYSHNEDKAIQEKVLEIARGMDKKISGESNLPEELVYLPKEGQIPYTTRYIFTDFMGLSFFKSVFKADYSRQDDDFVVFILKHDSPRKCKKQLKAYLKFTHHKGRAKQKAYVIEDPYNGMVYLQWKDNFLWGVLNIDDKKTAQNYLQKTEKKLPD